MQLNACDETHGMTFWRTLPTIEHWHAEELSTVVVWFQAGGRERCLRDREGDIIVEMTPIDPGSDGIVPGSIYHVRWEPWTGFPEGDEEDHMLLTYQVGESQADHFILLPLPPVPDEVVREAIESIVKGRV